MNAEERDGEGARDRPQDADEAQEQDGRLEEADGERHRPVGDIQRILLDALVRVFRAFQRCIRRHGAAAAVPQPEEIDRKAAAEQQRRRLREPGLRHVADEKRAGNQHEDFQLVAEFGKVSLLDRIVEGAVPVVQQNLDVGCQADEDHETDGEKRDACSCPRVP